MSLIRCTSCSRKIRLTVLPEDAGKRVAVTCPCGQKLRTRLPKPDLRELVDNVTRTIDELEAEMGKVDARVNDRVFEEIFGFGQKGAGT